MNTVAPRRRTRRPPGRPRNQDSTVNRDGIVLAAVDLVARQGYAATSMAQVAEAAGISPSGLVHHFPTKKALLGAVLEHRDAVDSDPRPPIGETPWNMYEHLVRVGRANMDRTQVVRLYTTMVGEAVTPEHPAHPWMRRHYADVLHKLTAGMRMDIAAGHVREDAPVEHLAREMVALMDGLQVQWLLDPEVDMAAILAEHVAGLRSAWGRAAG